MNLYEWQNGLLIKKNQYINFSSMLINESIKNPTEEYIALKQIVKVIIENENECLDLNNYEFLGDTISFMLKNNVTEIDNEIINIILNYNLIN